MRYDEQMRVSFLVALLGRYIIERVMMACRGLPSSSVRLGWVRNILFVFHGSSLFSVEGVCTVIIPVSGCLIVRCFCH